jgi:outer membrane receptor for Fe3+-dicitrate
MGQQNGVKRIRAVQGQTYSSQCDRKIIVSLSLLVGVVKESRAAARQSDQENPKQLKQLSLEQLGNIEVTTASNESEQVWRTAAAIYVLTRGDIDRSGAIRITEVLRLVPGFEAARSSAVIPVDSSGSREAATRR